MVLLSGSRPLLRFLLPGALVLATAGSASAQFNATLLDNFNQVSSSYADIWGDGQFAYVGRFGQNQVDIVNMSNPSNLSLASTWNVPNPDGAASAQDVKGNADLMFVSLESADPNGVQILDVRVPGSPQFLTNIDAEPGFFEQIHNTYFKDDWLYIVNSADPTIALIDLTSYDINSPPASITGWDYQLTGVGNTFVHDITVQNGVLFAAAWDSIQMYDVSNLASSAPTFLGQTLGLNTHAVWGTDDGAYLVLAEERQGGSLRLYSVVDNGSSITLVPRDSYVSDTSFSSHNPVIVGDRVYSSFYSDGVIVLEIDRTTHTWEVVAQYDTSTAAPTGFAGAWGVYPLIGEDRVLISDMQNGVYTVDFSAVQISFAAARPQILAPFTDEPITVELTGIGASVVDPSTVALNVSVDGGGTQVFPMSNIGGNQWQADLPGSLCGAELEYWVSVDDLSGATFFDPATAPAKRHRAFVATGLTTVFADNFNGNTGWSVSNSGGLSTGAWERGDPNQAAGQPESGDPDGTVSCFFTDQGPVGGSAGANDIDGGSTTLTSPALNFSAGDGLITYSEWYFNNLVDDTFVVEISNNGSTWVNVKSLVTKAGGWVRQTVRVSDYVTPTANVRIRFTAEDQGAGSITEAAIDEVTASVFECDPAASTVVRNGTAVNALGYQAVTEPVLGQSWQTTVDIATPGALASVVSIGLGGPAPPGLILSGFLQGELLILGPFTPHDVSLGSHGIPVPLDAALLGVTLATQGSAFSPGVLLLYNAIDATIGF